jgi:hypothetical protein
LALLKGRGQKPVPPSSAPTFSLLRRLVVRDRALLAEYERHGVSSSSDQLIVIDQPGQLCPLRDHGTAI